MIFFAKKILFWGEKMNVIFSDVFSFSLFFFLGWGPNSFFVFFFKKPKSEDRDLDVFCVVTPIPLVVRSVRSVP